MTIEQMRRHGRRAYVAFFMLFSFATVSAQVADSVAVDSVQRLPWNEAVAQRLQQLLADELFETSQVGMMVWDLDADSALFRHQERQTLRPASTQKLLTAITALDQLGGGWQLATKFYLHGSQAGRTFNGNIWVEGGMDPCLETVDLQAFVDSLRTMGIDTVSGNIYADRTMKDENLMGEGWCWDDKNPVLSPLLFGRKDVFVERLMTRLRESGITLQTRLAGSAAEERPRVPSAARRICVRMHTLDQVLVKMMKESDNLYAESVFYQLAKNAGERPATAKGARAVVKRLINRLGLRPEDYYVADGSGLSLYNYVSAELMVRMLRYAAQNEQILAHLKPTLPVAGMDGTLKNRMKDTPARGNVCAKTGTLTGISSLAGYLTAPNGHRLCFAIINQGLMKASRGRDFQDKVCTVLCIEH